MGKDARKLRLGDNHQIDPLGDVQRGPVEGIEEGGTRRAWQIFVEGTREHEVVDRERVFAGHEQLREPHVGRGAVGPCLLENVVLRDDPAGRKLEIHAREKQAITKSL